jgi:hypothetical protein
MATATLVVQSNQIKVVRETLLLGTASISYESLDKALTLAGFVLDHFWSRETFIGKHSHWECTGHMWRHNNIVVYVDRDTGLILCHPQNQQKIIDLLNSVKWEEPSSHLHKQMWKEDTFHHGLIARPTTEKIYS